ncbi:hypothetical protein ACF0H5_019295 [Mactra antiquata]
MDRYNKGGKDVLPLYQPKAMMRKSPNHFPGVGLAEQFQISGYMMIASGIFWMCMIYFGIRGIQYGLMYRSFDDSNLEEIGCCTSFGGTLQDGLNFMETYDKGVAGPYLMRLGPETYNSGFKGTPSPKELENIPVIVTAVSSADFWHVQSLIRQWNEEIKPTFKTATFIIFDIGLYNKELELIKEYCKCEVRTFTVSAYPQHVADISTFAYRPIIIQTMIEEFGSVIWMNPNMLFTQASDLNQLKFRGKRDFFIWQPREFIGTIAYTSPKMFEYLKESRCCMVDAGLTDISTMVFYRSNITWSAIMKPWLLCALNKDCISPPKARYSGCFEMRAPKTTGCHRYDQSALSIILERAFQISLKTEKFLVPRISRQQDEYLEYFPEQPWTFTEIFFVSLVPFTCLGGLGYMFWRRKSQSAAKSNYRRR